MCCVEVRRLFWWVLVVAACMSAAAPAQAGPAVYLMRGLMDVSTGLDDLAAQLRKRGIKAVVGSYVDWQDLAAAAIREHRAGKACPVAIIGHSLGANAAVDMSAELKAAGVPVALMVSFSPAFTGSVPDNVRRVVNYYQSNSLWNNKLSGGAGFKGTLRNVDVAADASIDHFNIEKNARLKSQTLEMVAGMARSCAGTRT